MSVFLGSFVLLEHLALLLTSAFTINCWLGDFLSKAIGIVNFEKHFQDFIDDAVV